MIATIDILSEVREILTNYLEANGQRKTNERYIILEEVYLSDTHFEAEDLYKTLVEKDHSLSRATVYNTLDLLVSANLAIKHQFGENLAHYEKSYKFAQHDHLICGECKKVVEFCDPRIQSIKTKMGELFNFKITHHRLNIFGICAECSAKQTK